MDKISGHIKLNEQDRLIVENDNATIENDLVSSELHGNYMISADDLKRLLVTLNGGSVVENIYVRQYDDFDLEDYLNGYHDVLRSYTQTKICVTKDVTELIENLISHIDNQNKIIRHFEKQNWSNAATDVLTYRSLYEELKRRVERHNKTHLFGKIKITETDE